MSGPTIFGSNGKEQFTDSNPAIVQVKSGSLTPSGKQDVSVKDPLPAGTNVLGKFQISDDLGSPIIIDNYGSNDAFGTLRRGILTGSLTAGYNGTNWDRWRNNQEGTLLASAPRASLTKSPIQKNYNAKGVVLYLNISSAPNTAETLDLRVVAPDIVNNQDDFSVIASFITEAGSAIQSGARYKLYCYPSISYTAPDSSKHKAVSMVLPRTWLSAVNHIGGTSPWTYTVSYSLIL